MEAALFGGDDLRLLQGGRDAASTPRPPYGCKAVMTVLTKVVHRRVADDLLTRESDEEQLRNTGWSVDLDRPPELERGNVGRAGDLLEGLEPNRVELLE